MDERAAAPGDDAADEEAHSGVIRGLLASALDAVRTRLDLATVEVEIYLLRTVHLVVWAIAAVACCLLALAFGLVTLVVALWDTHRMAALLGGTVAFVALAATFASIGARALRNRPRMLEGTLQQLEHDQRRAGGVG